MKIKTIGKVLAPFVVISFFVLLTYFTSIQFAHASPVRESDLNKNGVPDHTEALVTMTQSTSLPAGEYTFNKLVITNKSTLTLEGNQNSPDPFKGVKINATNLTVNAGSAISANAQGYVDGPGAPSLEKPTAGASYGGAGYTHDLDSVYGNNLEPLDLGSGGYSSFRGGGAIWLVVSDTLANNGSISANGAKTSSGGSIYIVSKILKGNGLVSANGGIHHCPNGTNNCVAYAGGGGRIMISYENNSFIGNALANGGCGGVPLYNCAFNGSVGLFDILKNDLYLNNTRWTFLTETSPLVFNSIYILGNSHVTSEESVVINADSLFNAAAFSLGERQVLNIKTINLDRYSTLNLSGSEVISTDNLNLEIDSWLSLATEKIFSLTVKNLNIGARATIDAQNKGYMKGPGSSIFEDIVGASHGGLGVGNTGASIYGDVLAPINFGSGTELNKHRGGGAIRIVVTNNFTNDGTLTFGGYPGSSGGSIYITTKNLLGSGKFNVDGGRGNCYYGCGAGGGGRIAIYYENSTFTGTVEAKGGCDDNGSCAGDGTVIMKQIDPACGEQCFSNVMFFPGIMGSRLYLQEPSGEKELWVSADDALQSKLTLNTNGKNSNVYTKNDTQTISDGYERETGVVDEIVGGNIYNSFLFDLKDWKKEGTINDYHFIPYDWRVALEDIVVKGGLNVNGKLFYNNNQTFSESFILKKLKELQATSRTGKVTLVGHSNGGLVIKALIQKLKETNDPLYDKIDQVIFVGTPQIGTPQALINMLHGSSMGPIGFVMTAKRNRQLAENMPTTYNMLPSTNYFSTITSSFANDHLISFENKPFFKPQLDQYGVSITNSTELKNYILGTDGRVKPSFNDVDKPNIGNVNLYPQSETVHQILDSWQPASSTKVVQLGGVGEETISGIRYQSFINLLGVEKLKKKINVSMEGDETVMADSALWMSETNPNIEKWWIDLEKEGGVFSDDRTHKDLLEISNLRDFIKSKITGVPFSDSEDVVVNHYPTTTFAPRIHYHLFTEGRVGIVDAKGRYTGVDFVTGKIRQEIPNTRYIEIGTTKFISVPDGLAYTLKIDPKEDVVMDVDRQVGNNITDSDTVISKFSKNKLLTIEASVNLDVKGLKFKEVLKDAVNTNQ